jgi:hypothetical protein
MPSPILSSFLISRLQSCGACKNNGHTSLLHLKPNRFNTLRLRNASLMKSLEFLDGVFTILRRTCVSGMARLGIAPHVADKVLNHQSGTISGVAAVYQRHDFLHERRVALERWGAHVAKVLMKSLKGRRTVDQAA